MPGYSYRMGLHLHGSCTFSIHIGRTFLRLHIIPIFYKIYQKQDHSYHKKTIVIPYSIHPNCIKWLDLVKITMGASLCDNV